MSKIEYKVTELKFWFFSKNISSKMEEHINIMTQAGWELNGQISSIGLFELPNYIRFIWKRNK